MISISPCSPVCRQPVTSFAAYQQRRRRRRALQVILRETWRNLECLRERTGAARPLALRVYVRHPDDYPVIRAFLEARLSANVATVYLHADICRAELLLEIEGVYAMPLS